MPDVAGIGSAFIDYFFEVDKQFLKEFKLKPQDDLLFRDRNLSLNDLLKRFPVLYQSPGGMVGNTLAVLNHLGVSAGYCGVLGKDSPPALVSGINKTHALIKGQTSVCACLLSDKRKNRAFFSQMNPEDNYFFQHTDLAYLKKAKFIFIGPFLIDPDKRCQDLEQLINKLPEARICWSPSIFYARLGLKKLTKLLARTEILFFNQEEVKLLTKSGPKVGSKKLLKCGPKVVVCTLGGKGVLITTTEEQFHLPAKKVNKVVDTTGAGDAFAAGFISGLLQDKSLKQSAKIAINISAKAITNYGLSWLKS